MRRRMAEKDFTWSTSPQHGSFKNGAQITCDAWITVPVWENATTAYKLLQLLWWYECGPQFKATVPWVRGVFFIGCKNTRHWFKGPRKGGRKLGHETIRHSTCKKRTTWLYLLQGKLGCFLPSLLAIFPVLVVAPCPTIPLKSAPDENHQNMQIV